MALEKKYVLITGVSTGIGNDAVGYLTENGYHVFGSVRKEEDVKRLIAQYPNNFTCLQFDVTKLEEVKLAFDKVATILDGKLLNGFVNNAGLAIGGPMELMDDDKFRYQMEVNLFAVRNVTNIFLPLLKGDKKKGVKGGKIIMISSLSGIFNTPFNGAYCVSKHAMESLAEIYRRELLMYDIDVVSIQPGPIQTKIWDKNVNKYEEYENTAYAQLTRRSNKIMQKAEKDALPARVISKLILKIVSKKTKLAFPITKNKWITVLFIKYMPARWADKIFYKQLYKQN